MLTIQEQAIKMKCEKSLIAYTRYMFKEYYRRKFIVAHHHKVIAKHLERTARGEITRLIITIPPRYSKTELAVKMYCSWCIAKNPAAKFIHLSYDDGLALDNSNDVKEYIKHPSFQKFWPVEIKKSKDSKKSWGTEQNGAMHAGAAGGAVTGFGAGAIDDPEADEKSHWYAGAMILDDLLKPDDAHYETKRKKINERYSSTFISRLNSDKHTPIIIIMQRIHMDDFVGHVLENSGEEWTVLNMPAINEDGEALWPEKHSIERLREMEKADKYTFAAQFQQNPIPFGGGKFKTDMIEVINEIPNDVHKWVRYWDKAGTEGDGCFSAGVLMGKRANGKTVVANVTRGQWSALPRERNIKQTAQMDPPSTNVWVEQEGGSGGKESAESTVRNLSGHIVKSETASGDKVVRAYPFECQVEAGNVQMVRGPWNRDYLDELKYFPFGKYKDQVDASSGAFNKLHDGGYDLYALTG